jgi:hypothetical protein
MLELSRSVKMRESGSRLKMGVFIRHSNVKERVLTTSMTESLFDFFLRGGGKQVQGEPLQLCVLVVLLLQIW